MQPVTTQTIEAIFQDGVFKPLGPVDLAENQRVHLVVGQSAPEAPATRTGSLFGAFPALAALTGDDLAWARQAWERGLGKQADILRRPQRKE